MAGYMGILIDYISGLADNWKSTSGAAHVQDAVSLSGFSRSADLSVSTSAAQTAALDGGTYDVRADVDCYLKVGETADDATTLTGYPLPANTTIPLVVPAGEKIGAITASGSGTLTIHRVR